MGPKFWIITGNKVSKRLDGYKTVHNSLDMEYYLGDCLKGLISSTQSGNCYLPSAEVDQDSLCLSIHQVQITIAPVDIYVPLSDSVRAKIKCVDGNILQTWSAELSCQSSYICSLVQPL